MKIKITWMHESGEGPLSEPEEHEVSGMQFMEQGNIRQVHFIPAKGDILSKEPYDLDHIHEISWGGGYLVPRDGDGEPDLMAYIRHVEKKVVDGVRRNKMTKAQSLSFFANLKTVMSNLHEALANERTDVSAGARVSAEAKWLGEEY